MFSVLMSPCAIERSCRCPKASISWTSTCITSASSGGTPCRACSQPDKVPCSHLHPKPQRLPILSAGDWQRLSGVGAPQTRNMRSQPHTQRHAVGRVGYWSSMQTGAVEAVVHCHSVGRNVQTLAPARAQVSLLLNARPRTLILEPTAVGTVSAPTSL